MSGSSSFQPNTIYPEDCLFGLRRRVPDNSTGLVFTSPPYNVGIDYGACEDQRPLHHCMIFLEAVFAQCARVLVPGGHLVVNIANTGRNPYLPLAAALSYRVGTILPMRGEILWDKGGCSAFSTWGSWCSPNSPALRDRHEYLLVFRKPGNRTGTSTIGRDEFLASTQSIWRIRPETNREHPAPFRVELARRIINFFSFREEIVLDPFMGSGTTAVAAVELDRRFVGFEINPRYVRLAERRLKEYHKLQVA